MKEPRVMEAISLLVCFSFAAISGLLGLSLLVGAFIAGMAIADSVSYQLINNFIKRAEVLFVPLFFVVMGGSMDPRALLTGDFLLMFLLSLVAIGSKLIGCGLPGIFFLKSREKGLRVGYGMISRGEIGLVITSMGITYHIISMEVYSALIIVIFITSLLPPFFLKRSYQRDDKTVAKSN